MRSKIAALTAAIPLPPEADEADVRAVAEAKKAADAEREIIEAEIEASKAGESTVVDKFGPGGRSAKYVPGKTQPRDAAGKFRKVLARLKQDLGVAGLQQVMNKVEDAENLEFAGNYAQAAESASDLINTIDRLDTGALDATKIESVRDTAGDLGRVIANLPLPFTNQAQKVRFSDLPPALKNLVDDMIMRVETKIGKEDADVATEGLRSYMAGGDFLNQSQVSSQLSKMLRLLT
jgi:hypothetical protein